jgi:hypothetical protein
MFPFELCCMVSVRIDVRIVVHITHGKISYALWGLCLEMIKRNEYRNKKCT